MTSRRDFFRRATGAGVGVAAVGSFPFGDGLHASSAARPAISGTPMISGGPAVHRAHVTPVAVASDNGRAPVTRAIEVLHPGGDTLEAVVRGVNIVGRPDFGVEFYAVNKRGEYGSASIWSGVQYAVSVDGEMSMQDAAYVFQRA